MDDDDEEDQIKATNSDEEDDLEYIIQHISNAEHLSPSHTNSLKIKKGKSKVPLQVTTRSRRGKIVSCDQ